MFFSSVGIISDHVARRVHELDRQKVYNRVRKASEVYKRREAQLELARLADAETRKKASGLRKFEYKAGPGAGGSKTYMGDMTLGSQELDAQLKAAEDKKAELKSLNQGEMKALFASGQTQGLLQCQCGWVSRGKHSGAHKKSAHHLKWRWDSNDRAGIEVCGQAFPGRTCAKVLVSLGNSTTQHREKCKAKADKGGQADDADDADADE